MRQRGGVAQAEMGPKSNKLPSQRRRAPEYPNSETDGMGPVGHVAQKAEQRVTALKDETKPLAEAEQAWKEFHGFINAASNSVIKSTGRGFYVDLHGQSHPIKRVELGYLLKPWQLTNSDAVLDQPAYAAQSSIRTLAAQVPIPFSQLLRGSNSLGALLLSNGYPAVPSPAMPSPWANRNPDPTSGAPSDYFDGGFNTRMHGSIRQGGGIDGVQMEVNLAGLRDTAANRSKFAAALAQAMDVFFARNFVIDLRSSRSLSAGVSKQVELHSDATSLPRRRSPVENPL